MKKLNNNISLTESFKKLQEQKQEIYTPDKQYIVTYIDTDGQTQNVNYTPETEMNIVEIISKFKEENENFFKLYSIDENLKEAIRQEYNLQNPKLQEDNTPQEEPIMSEKEFKKYIFTKLKDCADYIKLFKTKKISKNGQWGIYVYGKDILADNGTKLNGFSWYIPYDDDIDNFVDPLLELTRDEILKYYNNKDIKLVKENKKLNEEYEVWQRYFNEDGTTTTEYVMSFEDYNKAQNFADSLSEDPNCEAWVKELNENKKITEAYEVHNELNPKLWNNETKELLPEVQESLWNISQEFIKYIDIPLEVVDVQFVGSNASYNYNEQSDIDLHLIVNFDINYVDNEILQTLYNAKKNSFNDNYDLDIKGIPVELYIEDIKAMNASLAIYSVQNKQWIKEPQPIEYKLPNVQMELGKRLEEIDDVCHGTDEQAIKTLLNDIYMDRKNGLATDGEASKGNVIFKELRNLGKLDLLRDKYYELRSNKLSVNENKLTEEREVKELEKPYRMRQINGKYYIDSLHPYDETEYAWAINTSGDINGQWRVYNPNPQYSIYMDIDKRPQQNILIDTVQGYENALELIKQLDSKKKPKIDRT